MKTFAFYSFCFFYFSIFLYSCSAPNYNDYSPKTQKQIDATVETSSNILNQIIPFSGAALTLFYAIWKHRESKKNGTKAKLNQEAIIDLIMSIESGELKTEIKQNVKKMNNPIIEEIIKELNSTQIKANGSLRKSIKEQTK